MNRFAIMLGGPLQMTERVKHQLSNARIIAADGGIVHCHEFNIKPELWVGDFDSTSPHWQHVFHAVPKRVFSRSKNQTDGEIAIRAALDLGADTLILMGGVGGQSDHSLSLQTLLLSLKNSQISGFLTNGLEEVWPIVEGKTLIEAPIGSRFSIIPLSDLVNLNLVGARWPLRNAMVKFGATLTLSNEISSVLKISLQAGLALCYIYLSSDQSCDKQIS